MKLRTFVLTNPYSPGLVAFPFLPHTAGMPTMKMHLLNIELSAPSPSNTTFSGAAVGGRQAWVVNELELMVNEDKYDCRTYLL